MKIWIVTSNNPLETSKFYGGVEIFFLELQKKLSRNHTVTLINSEENKSEFVKSLTLASKVRKMLKSERPDILISNGILGWAMSDSEVPRVNIYHGTYEGMRKAVPSRLIGNLHKKIILAELEKLSGRNALKVAVSNNTAEELTKYYGFSKPEIFVVEGGTDTNRFSPVANEEEKMRLRKKYNLPANSVVCAFTASFTFRKGWDIVQRLSETFRDFTFLCTSKNFRHENIVGIELNYDTLHEIYQLSDIYLYPSRYDGFSLGLIEAMSCGLPFVGFPSGFCRDLKNNSEFSQCIANGEDDFARLLRNLSDNESLRLGIGGQCRKYAQSHDWCKVAEKFSGIFRQAIIKDVAVNVERWYPTKKKLELSLNNPMDMVLDAGCGTGWLSQEHSRNLEQVIALDTAKDRVEISKSRRAFDVCRADTSTLPFGDDVFDAVMCYDVLEHIPRHIEALCEFRRVLKTKGKLIIAVPNSKGSYTLIHDRLMHFRKKSLKHDQRLDHSNFFSHQTFLSLLNKHGFKVIKMANIEFLSPVFYKFRRFKIASALSEFDTNLAKKLSPEIASEWVMICQK